MLRDDQRIEKIRLVEVGPFLDSSIEFPQAPRSDRAELHIFTGENGSGKSTLLFALASLFGLNDPDAHFAEIKKRFRSNMAAIYATVGETSDVYLSNLANEIAAQQGGLKFRSSGAGQLGAAFSSYWLFDKSEQFSRAVHLPNQWKSELLSFLPLAYSGNRALSSSHGVAIKEDTESPLKNHLSFQSSVSSDQILQWIANVEAQSALAARDGDPEAEKGYRKALVAVQAAINDICNSDYSFALMRSPLNVVLKQNDVSYEFDVLPDGLKSVISWIADVLMRMDRIRWTNPHVPLLEQPLILFLDEIDIHLHPKWQRRVLPVVQKLFPNAQIFVSTHSPFVVGSVRDAWVYNLDKKGKEIVAEPAGAGHSYEVVLEEVFGITEHFDIESQQLLARLKDERRKLLESASALDKTYVEIAKSLAARSEELDAIVSADIRQIAKHGRKIELAEAAGG